MILYTWFCKDGIIFIYVYALRLLVADEGDFKFYHF